MGKSQFQKVLSEIESISVLVSPTIALTGKALTTCLISAAFQSIILAIIPYASRLASTNSSILHVHARRVSITCAV